MSSADASLTVALTAHANRMVLILEDRDAFWRRLAARVGFDPPSVAGASYRIERVNGKVCVVELDPKKRTILDRLSNLGEER